MRPETSSGPLGVQRQFETNRLAKDFQARAYEEVVPVVGRSRTGTAATGRAGAGEEQTKVLSQGGSAA